MSTIRIYEKNETQFTHNGIKTLHPITCKITRNLFDYTYDLDMEHPIDDSGVWKEIVEGRIVKVNNQYFRIVHINTSVIDNTLTIYAKHVFFDLQNNFIEDTNIISKNGNMSLIQLLNATTFEHSFTSYSDISLLNNMRCVRKNVIDAILGEDDNTFISRWGGELDIDGFNIKMVNQVGEDKGYKISYGKNLTGLTIQTDCTEIVTRIRPVGFDGIELSDDNKYVDSAYINDYAMPIIKEYKYENVKWTGSPNYEEREDDDTSTIFDDLSLAQAELTRLASLEFTENKIDLPKVTCEVNFVELSQTEEYSQFKNLEKVSLGDIVTIYHKPLGFNVKARCISYVYDCLLDSYESVTIGSYQKNFFLQTARSNEKTENLKTNISEEIQSVYTQAISKMSEMMNNSMTGYVVLSNSEILIMDSPEKKEAKNVWKFNSSGIAHSSTGYEGEYTVGMTMDGHINGALITAGTIKGDMLEVGTITTRELAVEIQNTINTAMTEEKTQAMITANLNTFESSLSQTYITQENATKQIQTATEIAIEGATQEIVNTSVTKAIENVNDQLDGKLSNYTTNTLNSALQNAMSETLQDSKDYVVSVTGNYYTKSQTDSIISQTRTNIELGVSSKYETKENTSIKITEAVEGVNVGAVNRVFGSSEEKTRTFTGIGNETFHPYTISPDISDKDVIISFEYDLVATVLKGSIMRFQIKYVSMSNQTTYWQYPILSWTTAETVSLKKQTVSFSGKFSALKQDATFGFRLDGVTGTFTVRNAQIKVGNKITEWSIAPEDIEDNANNFTITQLSSYYTKEQTDARISIAKEEINLGVSSTYETIANVTTKTNNTLNSAKTYADTKKTEAINSANNTLKTTIVNYYTKTQTDSAINVAKNSITSSVSSTYATKAQLTTTNTNVTNLTNRVTSAESKLTKNSLTTTIGNYYTTSSDVNGLITSKGYATTSTVTQTINALEMKFSQSGGYNLFKNSKFHNGYGNFWRSQTYNNPQGSVNVRSRVDTWGFPDAEANTIEYILPIGKSGVEWGLAQTIETTIGKQYTISFYYAGHRCTSANLIVRNPDSSWHVSQSFNPKHYIGGNSSANNWGRMVCTFTATQITHTINIVMNNCSDANIPAYLWIAKPQCEEGSVATAWSPAPNEVMTGITTINEYGITVSHSNVNTTSSMSADGFKITRTSDGKNVFNATNGNLTMEGVLSTGTSGKYIKVSDSNYKMYNGSTLTGMLGLYSNDIWTDSPKLYLGQEGVGESTGKTFFSISSYKANKNPQSYAYGYTDIAQFNPTLRDYSNIKMYGDGIMRISPLNKLEITTNYVDNSYAGTNERSLAEFSSSSSTYYDGHLDIGAVTNHDRNSWGLVLEHNRGGTYTAVRVNVDSSLNRYFRPCIDNNTECGSSGFRWSKCWSANGFFQTSDSRYKAITDDTDIRDCFDMVKNTKIYNYVMLDKNKEKMDEFERVQCALTNVGQDASVQVGMMAQDLLKYKCGKQIVVHEDIKDEDGNIVDDIYSINPYPLTSAVMGGLQYEIKQREQLAQTVIDLHQTILDLQQRIKDLEEK